MTERSILWTITEPRGLSVSLAADAWEHIVQEHYELASHFDALRRTVEDPDEIYFDPASTAKRASGAQVYAYYRSNLLSGLLHDKLVYVSVKFVREGEEMRGYVRTAMPSRMVQMRMERIWSK